MAERPARRSRSRSNPPVKKEEEIPARQSPAHAESRSRSPRRSKKNRNGGFRWKEKRSNDTEERETGGLQRGYRDRSPRRDRIYGKDRDRESQTTRSRSRSPRRDRQVGNGNKSPSRDNYSNRNHDLNRPQPSFGSKRKDRDDSGRREKKNAAAPNAAPSIAGQEMIIVNVNDRLGTKTAIPCLADDTIRSLKLMVAMRIGREPHEILLKRQSERPFKDQLTLRDYGISHGVQIDLEVDTGD